MSTKQSSSSSDEKKSGSGKRQRSGEPSKGLADRVFENWKAIAVVIVVFAAAVSVYTTVSHSNAAIQNLTNADESALKAAFFNEKPHLFYCDRNENSNQRTAAGTANTLSGLPGVFTHLNNIKGQQMNFAVLNCSQVLPSGKTIAERFSLKREVKPLIWGNAPWLQKPIQLLPKHMRDSESIRKHVEELFLTPKSIEVKSDQQMHKVCEFAKHVVEDDSDISPTCVALIRGEKYNDHAKINKQLEQKLILQYPKTRFVGVNGKALRFSFEDVDALPFDQFGLKVHAIRNGTHFLSMVNPMTWDYLDNFVSNALSSPLYAFTDSSEHLIEQVKHLPVLTQKSLGAHDPMVRLFKPEVISKRLARQQAQEERIRKAQAKKSKTDVDEEDDDESDSVNDADNDQERVEQLAKKKAERQRARAEAAQKKREHESIEKERRQRQQTSQNSQPSESTNDDDFNVHVDVNGDNKKSTEIDEAAAEQLRQQQQREQQLREQKRREEMEQQARAQVFEEDSEGDEEYRGEDEDADDIVIEL